MLHNLVYFLRGNFRVPKLKTLIILQIVFCACTIQATIKNSIFLGRYEQACHPINGDDYISQRLTFTAQELLWTVTAYEDESCQKPYLLFHRHFNLSTHFNLAKAYLDSQRRNCVINLVTNETSYTPLTAEVARALRLIHYCGENIWQNNKETIVTGKICDDYQQLAKNENLKITLSTKIDDENILTVDDDPIPFSKMSAH